MCGGGGEISDNLEELITPSITGRQSVATFCAKIERSERTKRRVALTVGVNAIVGRSRYRGEKTIVLHFLKYVMKLWLFRKSP